MARLFTEDGSLIGFDRSQINGQSEIQSHISVIFDNHVTPKYIGKINCTRFLSLGVGVILAVAGMVPPGKSDIAPDLNAIQTLVAIKDKEEWSIAIFQNTPAALHNRPELREKLTIELRLILKQRSSAN